MWIFCCGMQRGGSTIQYLLASEIVESFKIGKRVGFVGGSKEFFDLQKNEKEENKYLVVKCHDYIKEVRELVLERKAIVIYIYRDIRDVMVSWVRQEQKPAWRVINRKRIERLLYNYYNWTALENALISKYEDTIKDLKRETTKIAKTIGVHMEESMAEEIAKKYSINQTKKRIAQFPLDKLMASGFQPYDPHTHLHIGHIQSGKVGRYKKELSSLQVGFIEDIAFNWLVERGYLISHNWLSRKLSRIIYEILLKFYIGLLEAED